MGEVKSVKVDNWGVFFLQKLQNFFNKTDYCDLTLQFRDNSQLKVHRLVLSACTDYFNVLEQTCEIIDDALIMPSEFQADVVVPIVNFMYTGTLEFELKMYGKLLRTARGDEYDGVIEASRGTSSHHGECKSTAKTTESEGHKTSPCCAHQQWKRNTATCLYWISTESRWHRKR
ncbi:centrosome-associated zinc finger protein CP190-like [Drosophila nasuta]|uniref:centrosome-associated zinc finger protein CP190-like n=1 Tax=Drosophila nasuta TaxID=42062 RepID=UPI00295E7CD4|nr:centrosome-associated zinc finger protein CP190-like [Drosophila nasuta]XP_060650150.1 centrosome-associated zinc finger protein CP190-like [Drosophila nasuta]